ncbi:MAG: TonB-dependent receptor [Gammaproteobacteria bacterium]|nr:TonB-dependent receptor [Gammaproteobacteria bacterium]
MKPALLVSGLAAGASVFLADHAAGQAPGLSAASAQTAPGLEEVIVTAEKRPENIQTVPISIVAFSAGDLRQLGMTEGFDLANQVPNMNVDAPVADSNVRYFIRGVGTQDFNTLATSPIALYIDDVYLGSTIANSVNFYDMQRVEVLLGPQGTLWGKNTTGGAINFMSAHPTQTLAASGSAGYGNHGERFAEGMVNVPLTATLAARVAFTYSGRDAWIRNLAPDGPHNLDAFNKAGGRLSLEWTPDDTVTAYLKGEYLKRTGSTITGYMVPLSGPTDAFGNPALPFGVVNQAGGPSSDDFATWDVIARLDLNIGNVLELTSISAWRNAERIHEYELNGGTPALLINQAFFGNHDQFTQELRLTSENPGPFRWQGGLLYYFARETATTAVPFNETAFSAPAYITDDLWPESRKFNSGSVFGGIEYDLTPRLTAKGGLRYNDDEGSYRAMHYAVHPYANYLNYLNPDPLADPNSVLVPPDTIDTAAHWSKLTWDAGLRYHFSADKMVYVNGSTGYRQGTFSSPSGSSVDQFRVLQPETNLAFEIGAKTSWFGNRLQVSAAAFSYDYTNMQVFVLQPIAAGSPLSIESNAGKATDRGGEIELKLLPADRWLISGALGYVHAIFTEFDTETSAGVPVSLAGNRLPRQPQWTASSLLEYRWPLASGASVLLHTDWNYRGDYYVNADNLHNPYIPSRTVGNVRAAYTPSNDRWELALWARNVTDKHYPMGGYRLGFANSQIFYFGDPLTYGISATISF